MGNHRKSSRANHARWGIVGVFITGITLVVMGCMSTVSQESAVQPTHSAVTPSALLPPVPEISADSVTIPVAEPRPTVVAAPKATMPGVAAAPTAAPPAAAPPTHVAFPAVGISVATHPMDGTPYVLDPPHNGYSYWLNNYGMAGVGAADTVYIIGHSCYGAGCTDEAFPFNRLSDAVAAGQIITVSTANGTVAYQVTDRFTIFKDSTPAEKRGTWDKVPGRLVLISCYTENPLGENVIVFATMVEK